MKILRIVVDGYGKLIGKKLDLKPGLQIIIGPNEQGKSTLRSFIADMLYGQKRNTSRRNYEESNALREPWQGSGAYGGMLRYELDDEREIEVTRNFSKDRETIQVYDHTHAKDITDSFEKLRNNEISFAAEHLGLSKEVFINAATINHLTLEDLGDSDAMQHIREKLLSLADAGDDSHSADSVIQRLKERVVNIGQPNARIKPLPAAKNRLQELQQELHSTKNLHAELAETEARRNTLVQEIEELTTKRKEIETTLQVLQRHKDTERLNEAEALIAASEKLSREMEETKPSKSVPLEESETVAQQAATIETLKAQRGRTEEELLKQQAALNALKVTGDAGFNAKPEDIPEVLEKEYSESLAQLQRAKEGIQERIQTAQIIEAKYKEFQDIINNMPDFQRLADDPVEWLNLLSSSFYTAVRERDEDVAERDALRKEVDEARKAIEEDHEIFAEIQNLTDMTREFELRKRMLQEQLRQQGSDLQTLRANHEDVADRIPGLAVLSGLCVLFLGGLIGAYVAFENPAIFFAMGLAGIAILYFGGSLVNSFLRKRELETQIKEIKKLLGPYGGAEIEEEWEKYKKEDSKPEKKKDKDTTETKEESEKKDTSENKELDGEEEGDQIPEEDKEDAEEDAETEEEENSGTVDDDEEETESTDSELNEDGSDITETPEEEDKEEIKESEDTEPEADQKGEESDPEDNSDSKDSDDDEENEEEEEEEDEVQLTAEEEEPVAKLLEAAGCLTIRELEARYEKYRSALSENQVYEEELIELEKRAAESEEHVPRLLECLRVTFETQLLDKLEDEEDVQHAAKRAISKYQEYRDVKRRANDSRTQYEKLDVEIRQRKQVHEEAVAKRKKAEAGIRDYIRERGFDESAHEDVAAAVRGYRARLSELGETHGRVETMQKAVEELEKRFAKESSALESLEAEYYARLAKSGLTSLQEWKAIAELQRQYETLSTRKRAIEDQIKALLGGMDIDVLRKRVHGGPPLPNKPHADEDALKAQLEQMESAVDARKKEEYSLHLQLTERTASARSLNEVEEEISALEKLVQQLDFEREATSYAIAHIEDIARDKHARIAPILAERASTYLKAITSGAYTELLISRDMTISVRIPQTQRMHENPERSLSKGTVDQIYLALRLSLVQSMSDNGESIPMLLDDPFANYDDARLMQTMKILVDISQNNQVLLFTCREDVARAAEAVKAPVIRL